MNKFIIAITLFLVPFASISATHRVTGEIKRLGAMTQSIGYDHFLTIDGLDTLGTCRKAPDLGNLILFRVKKENGEKEVYSTALAAYMGNRTVELIIRDNDTDSQGSCYIAAISFI